jgi:hypothetical protein
VILDVTVMLLIFSISIDSAGSGIMQVVDYFFYLRLFRGCFIHISMLGYDLRDESFCFLALPDHTMLECHIV